MGISKAYARSPAELNGAICGAPRHCWSRELFANFLAGTLDATAEGH
jgi:hypothetical protein